MRRFQIAVLALLGVLAAGCGSTGGTPAYGEPEEDRMIRQGRLSRDAAGVYPELIIDVSITYVEDVLLPAGSTVRAALFDESHELKPAISSNAVTTRDERGGPITLEITYPMDQIDDSHEYVVRGEITDPDGVLLFTTEEPVQIIPNENEPQEIELVLKPPATQT